MLLQSQGEEQACQSISLVFPGNNGCNNLNLLIDVFGCPKVCSGTGHSLAQKAFQCLLQPHKPVQFCSEHRGKSQNKWLWWLWRSWLFCSWACQWKSLDQHNKSVVRPRNLLPKLDSKRPCVSEYRPELGKDTSTLVFVNHNLVVDVEWDDTNDSSHGLCPYRTTHRVQKVWVQTTQQYCLHGWVDIKATPTSLAEKSAASKTTGRHLQAFRVWQFGRAALKTW